MNEFNFSESTIAVLIASGVVLIVSILISFLSKLFLRVLNRRYGLGSKPGLIQIITKLIEGPIFLIFISIGLLLSYLILALSSVEVFDPLNNTDEIAITIWKVLVIALVTFTVSRLIDGTIEWYLLNIAENTDTKWDDTLLPTVRRILPMAIYAIGFLIAIDSIGISISPILAGLGIGGLAVALAVQPTLSNFFAGTYVVTEGELKPGDFIELDGGPSGYVEDVGWRSTKIRSRFNNLIIIPNSKMAESIVTNFFSPTPAMNVVVTCGVSYESNLHQVQKIALEEANALIQESDDAITDTTPFFGFSNFGDSNIDFFIFLQAVDRSGTFKVKSELIKRIHTRFTAENIEINYPVRKLLIPESEIPNNISEVIADN